LRNGLGFTLVLHDHVQQSALVLDRSAAMRDDAVVASLGNVTGVISGVPAHPANILVPLSGQGVSGKAREVPRATAAGIALERYNPVRATQISQFAEIPAVPGGRLYPPNPSEEPEDWKTNNSKREGA
jgi:hypothetical protein